jgi:outer membrane lipoprotein-sorting protein
MRPITAFLLALCVAAPAAAQTADEIVAKNIAAKGGLEKIQGVKSARMTGKMTLGPGIEAPIVLEVKRPNMMRLDITVQGIVGSQAFDGAKGWSLMPFAGSKVAMEMSAEELKMAEEQGDIDGPLVDYKMKGHTVELLGKDKVEGADVYKLKVTLKNGTVRTLFIDAEHFLEIREEARRTIRGTEMDMETIYGDYKPVDGMMMAHSIDAGAKGLPQRQKITVEKIELNVPIDDARFKMPEVK